MIAFEGAQKACEQSRKLSKRMIVAGRVDWDWRLKLRLVMLAAMHAVFCRLLVHGFGRLSRPC